MNSQFQKLAEQAGMYVDLNSKPWPKWMGAEECEVAYAKFAELIVRECMRMCDVAAVGYETHGHTKEANGCYSAKEYIEEHFGVEE